MEMEEVSRDLARRFRRARRAALEATLGSRADDDRDARELSAVDVPAGDRVEGSRAPWSETAPLERVSDEDAERALRAVYDYSRALGQSFRRYYRVDLPLRDLARILPRLGMPCAGGAFRLEDGPICRRVSAGCEPPPPGARACDYFREALAGLVAGISSGVFYARHESRGRGGDTCVDVLYAHPQSPARFGPLPDDVRALLADVCRSARLFDSTVHIEGLGVAEKTLYYTASRSGAPGDPALKNRVERAVAREFPDLEPREASPTYVF